MKKSEYTTVILQRRVLVFFVTIILIFLALAGRLIYIQIVNGEFLIERANLQWARTLPLHAQRGLIFDTNKAPLVSNVQTYDVFVRPVMVTDVDRVAGTLSSILKQSFDSIKGKIMGKRVSEVLIQLQVPREQGLAIIASNIPGVYLTANNERNYIGGDMLTQVLGYTTIDGVGQTGLEVFYNDYLKGVDGKVLTSADARGKELENNLTTFVPSIAGLDLNLYIDFSIQSKLEEILLRIMEEQKAKAVGGIVLDAETYGIVAMSSKPSFDLNTPPRYDLAMLNELSKNPMITDVYEPGSTFKLLTLAAALEENLTHQGETFFCPGYRVVAGQKIKCWRTKGHGMQTLVEGVGNSCNCVFMDLGLRLGVDKLYKYLRAFGIGSKTGVDFFAESGGILTNEKYVKEGDLARIAFGHSVAVTPLQLIAAQTALINGGYLMTPQFLQRATSPTGQIVFDHKPQPKRRVISANTSQQICYMMRFAVEQANAVFSYVPGYTLGGKTGTAQKYLPDGGGIDVGKYISSFAGFAPYENPKYFVLLYVDEPSNGVYYGSIVAAPYAKNLFEHIFEYKQIQPQNLEEALEKVRPTIVVPDFVGQTLGQAADGLRRLGLYTQVYGDGNEVIKQWPAPGVMTYSGAIVLLDT